MVFRIRLITLGKKIIRVSSSTPTYDVVDPVFLWDGIGPCQRQKVLLGNEWWIGSFSGVLGSSDLHKIGNGRSDSDELNFNVVLKYLTNTGIVLTCQCD